MSKAASCAYGQNSGAYNLDYVLEQILTDFASENFLALAANGGLLHRSL